MKFDEKLAFFFLVKLFDIEALEDQTDIAAAKKVEGDVKKRGTVSWKKAKKILGL